MQLKKFYFSRGGYGAYKHKLEYQDGNFHYSTWPEMEGSGVCIALDNPFRIAPGGKVVVEEIIAYIDPSDATLDLNPEKLQSFLNYAKRYCRHWKKGCFEPILDGEYWEVDIWIDEFRLKSDGSNAYPGNFELFILKLTVLTGGKMFFVEP